MTKLTRQILILVIFSGLLLGFYVIAIYGPKATRYTSGADVKIMDRFFRHREVPDSENFSKPGFQLKTA